MRIIITMDLEGEYADPDHSTGITEAGYEQLSGLLVEFGTDIDIKQDA